MERILDLDIEITEASLLEAKEKLLQLKSITDGIDRTIEKIKLLSYFLYFVIFLLGLVLGMIIATYLF